MSRYLILQSRDPLEGENYGLFLADQLQGRGNEVTLYFLENGAGGLRRGSAVAGAIERFRSAGGRVLAEDVALKARGIAAGDLIEGVEVSTMSELADLLVDWSDKALWY